MSTSSSDSPVSVSAGAYTCRSLGCLDRRQMLGGMMRMDVVVPGWRAGKPGQFALLQAEGSDCFLGRALSICGQSGETVSFLVAPIGKGTRELCGLPEQSPVWVLGPLGNGFELEALTAGPGRLLLVGGGAGIAPFPILIDTLAEGGQKLEVVMLAGFRDAVQARGGEVLERAVLRASQAGLSSRYEKVVEDGSTGPAERVTDLLARHLRPGDRVAVCGPEPMAKAVWQLCMAAGVVGVWFSLERNMACGVGSCHGCVIALTDGSYARVCREGPVFAGLEVFGG